MPSMINNNYSAWHVCTVVRSGTRRLIFYDAPVVLSGVTCTGTESSITECSLNFVTGIVCDIIAITQCEGECMHNYRAG